MNSKEIFPRVLLLACLAFANACAPAPVHPTPARRGIVQSEVLPGQLVDWDKNHIIVTVGNTTFRQGQVFSSDPPHPSFPFHVAIDTKAAEEFRQKMAPVLPPDVELVINASPLDMEHQTGESFLNLTPENKYIYTESAAFDVVIVEHVYPRWKNFDLRNPVYANSFAKEITGQILNFMMHETRHFGDNKMKLIDPAKLLPLNVREPTAIAAEYGSLGFAPVIIVTPIEGFSYNGYYKIFRTVEK